MDVVRPKIEHEGMVVIYDPDTGRIVHRHEVVTMEGGEHPDDDTIAAHAWDELDRNRPDLRKLLGKGASNPRDRLAILHADPASIKPSTVYRVDVTARKLVVDRTLQ
jgi:hypothetical protein